MKRDWLRTEVDRLVTAYKANDWAAVHAIIGRMIILDAEGGIVLTRSEAAQCAAALYTEDQIWGIVPETKALADRLAVAQ